VRRVQASDKASQAAGSLSAPSARRCSWAAIAAGQSPRGLGGAARGLGALLRRAAGGCGAAYVAAVALRVAGQARWFEGEGRGREQRRGEQHDRHQGGQTMVNAHGLASVAGWWRVGR
jgi:hypothetical protein